MGGKELFVKDLGPQISWKTVFLIEYVSGLRDTRMYLGFEQVPLGRPLGHSPNFLSPPQSLLRKERYS